MQSRKPKWVWWSTHESIESEIPSATAILETIIAVPLYWWIALKVGIFWPLMISVAVAPLVLLRSKRAVVRGVVWFEQTIEADRVIRFENARKQLNQFHIMLSISLFAAVALTVLIANNDASPLIIVIIFIVSLVLIYMLIFLMFPNVFQFSLIAIVLFLFRPNISFLIMFPMLIALYPIIVMIGATAIRILCSLAELQDGLSELPKNFRRVVICTSPAHIPELIPGIERRNLQHSARRLYMKYLQNIKKNATAALIWLPIFLFWAMIMYFPAWLYRLTIKSTAWFWWPLAFLGGDPQRAKNPKLFRWKVLGSLWAKVSLIGAALSLLAFFALNTVRPAVLTENPLITPIGYLLLVDWSRPWQAFAVAGAGLSIFIVLLVDDVHGEYEIALAQKNRGLQKAAERKFGWIERLTRLRLLTFIAFWLIVGSHALLYFNSQQCWFTLTPALQGWAEAFYGDRLPRPCQCFVWPVSSLEPLERLNAN